MPNLRGDVELSFASHPVSRTATISFSGGSGTVTTTGGVGTVYLLGNIWYDFDTGSTFTPYVGGGLGVADIMPNVTLAGIGTVAYNTSAFALAGQIGAGVKFKVADNVSLDLGYRVKDVLNGSLTGTPTGTNLTGVTYLDQAVQVGMQFGF